MSCATFCSCFSQATTDTTASPVSDEGLWSSFTKPFVKAGTWLKEGLEEVIHDAKDTKDIKRNEHDLSKNVLSYAKLNNDLGTLLHDFEESPFEIFIPRSTWEKYTESICKDELRNIPIDKNGVEAFIRNSNENIFKKDTAATSIPFVKKVIELVERDLSIKAMTCDERKPYYDHLERYFKPATTNRPWYKTAARWAGWAAVGILGPSSGYFLYQKLLAHHFNRPGITKQDIAKKIEELQKECDKKLKKLDIATSEQLKTSLQRSIITLEKTIEKLERDMLTPQKPSTLRKTAGVATQVGMMALTTYLAYIIFKKFDEYYLADHTHATSGPEFDQEPNIFEDHNITPDFTGVNESYFQYLFDVLKEEKKDLANTRLTLEQLQKIMSILEDKGHKQEMLSRMVLNLKSAIESKMSHAEHLKESAEYLEKVKAQAIMGVLFS